MREWLSGGAPPCQGGGRGFDPRLALFYFDISIDSCLHQLSMLNWVQAESQNHILYGMVLPSHFLFKILNILKTSLLKFHKQMNSREVLNGMMYIACRCDNRYTVTQNRRSPGRGGCMAQRHRIALQGKELPRGKTETIKGTFLGKGIRIDIYAKDSDGNAYDIEMQTTEEKDLHLRTRYYHSEMDSYQIRAGQKYFNLKQSIVIFICTYDPFKNNKSI